MLCVCLSDADDADPVPFSTERLIAAGCGVGRVWQRAGEGIL